MPDVCGDGTELPALEVTKDCGVVTVAPEDATHDACGIVTEAPGVTEP